jgi:hypothetical protein
VTFNYDESGQPTSLIDFRPMDAGDIIDGAIRVYRRQAMVFISILAVIVGLPMFVGQTANRYLTIIFEQVVELVRKGGGLESFNAFRSEDFLIPAIVMLIASGFMFFLAPIANAAMVHAVSETILGRPAQFSESLKAIWPKAGTIILAYLVYVLIVMVFFLPFIAFVIIAPLYPNQLGLVLGLFLLFPFCFAFIVYFMVKYLFIPQAVILDGTGAMEGLKRSFSLSSGYWWRTFGIYMLVAIIVGIIGSLLGYGILLVDYIFKSIPGVPDAVVLAIGGVLMTIISLILNPLSSIASTLLYYDLRIRKEGFDLILLAESL